MTQLIALVAFASLLAIVHATPVSKYDHKLEYVKWAPVFGNGSFVAPIPIPSSIPVTMPTTTPEIFNSSSVDVWEIRVGGVCQITRFPMPAFEANRYLECTKPTNNETEWPWLDKGIWILKQCAPGMEFHLLTQTCRSKRYIRRQQSICATNPTASFCPQPQQPGFAIQPQQQMMCQCPPGINVCACPQPTVLQPQPQPMQQICPPMPCPQQPCPTPQVYCPQPPQPCPLAPGGAANAREGDLCSWMLAPLAADPNNNKCFLQCVPAPGNAFCGRWVRMPCAPATIFDVNVQVCVHDPYNVPGPVPGWSAMNNPVPQMACNVGTNIGACNTNFQCPGQSVCQVAQPQSLQCQQQPQSCSMCCYTGGAGTMGGVGVPMGKK